MLSAQLYEKSKSNKSLLELTSSLREDLSYAKKYKVEMEALRSETCQLREEAKGHKEQVECLYSKLSTIQDSHSHCLPPQEIDEQEKKIETLQSKLQEAACKLLRTKEKIRFTQEQNCALNKEISSLQSQLQQSFQNECDLKNSYQILINKLQNQISEKTQELTLTNEELRQKCCLANNLKEQLDALNNEACEENSISQIQSCVLEELNGQIKNHQLKIKNLISQQACESAKLHSEISRLKALTKRQEEELHLLRNETDNSGHDFEAEELLNEVFKLQNDVATASKTTLCSGSAKQDCESKLLSRVRRVRNRIISRLSSVGLKKEDISEKLDNLRCEFASAQEEIAHLRACSQENNREAILQRVMKEQELTNLISKVEKERKRIVFQQESLHKALVNLKKVREFIRYLR